MPLYLFYTMVQKLKNDQKLKSRGGPALTLTLPGTLSPPPSSPSKNPVTLLRIHSSKIFWKLVQKGLSWHNFGFHGKHG